MSVTIKFRNKDRLFQSLRNTVPAIDAELRKALSDSGEEMVAKASQLVPVDEGDLRKSIKWSWTRNTQASSQRSPAIVVEAGGESSDPAYYGRFVEFGTPDTPKQPFFFPAFRLLRKKIRSRLTRAVTKAIKKAGFGTK